MADFWNDLVLTFGYNIKSYKQKGKLVYEYAPLHNYRLDKDLYYDQKQYYDTKEEAPENSVLYRAGQLGDFITKELKFDLEHPVDMIPQQSYDNSLNLIINDNKNKPRIINTRFSPISSDTYQIVDRKGNNDTNIYDRGNQFDIDVSLYKTTVEIPKLLFKGVSYGGQLKIGNYHFYFKYLDADGNESDFVAESGLVSVFKGTTPRSVHTGWRDEISNKLVRFELQNVDSGYQYVNVYYTKSSGDVMSEITTAAFKIDSKYIVDSKNKCNITITGFENVIEVPLSEINLRYEICDTAKTQAITANRLFLGNITKPEILYKELTDVSLHFLPRLTQDDYDLQIDQTYKITSRSKGYYDPNFIYDKVGYWDDELYRFGIVYILPNNTLTPVFNVRGINNLNSDNSYTYVPIYAKDGNNTTNIRSYIQYNESTFLIETSKESEDKIGKKAIEDLENAKGVVHINATANDKQQIIGIKFEIDQEALDYLISELQIKGFFFVRQKRIFTTICQAYMIGVDPESNTPVLPVLNSQNNKSDYITERFVNNDRKLVQNFDERKYTFQYPKRVRTQAAICPDYDINYPDLNSIFCVNDCPVRESKFNIHKWLESDIYHSGHFYSTAYRKVENSQLINTTILGVQDNVKLLAINNDFFSSRAGEAEESNKLEFIEKEKKDNEASNVLRGAYGPYLAITGFSKSGTLIDIKVPGYNEGNMLDYFKIRYEDSSSYYAISDRISIKTCYDYFDQGSNKDISHKPSKVPSNIKEETEPKTVDTLILKESLYRGDCYICQFTHRVNRNFQDPSFPTGDKIIDPDCWDEHYVYTDKVLKKDDLDLINLADLNAVQLGMWVTLTVRSTYNLNVRSLDDSFGSEQAMFGHERGYYPKFPMSRAGSYKIPEALCYNKGFEKSVSERWNMPVQDAPAFLNDFSNRIVYSDINVNQAFENGFRTFTAGQYYDYPKTYGEITKIVEFNKNLVCVYEHGIDLIPINERAMSGEGSGGTVFLKSDLVLSDTPNNISDIYGSQWKDSIIKTPNGLYGVDTVAKKIWLFNGSALQIISDLKIGDFLNRNITLKEHEKIPILGIRNVKTHYNSYKYDVMFTYYDDLGTSDINDVADEKVWNICYNEKTQTWTTFYSWIPSFSENIYNIFFSYDRDTSKSIARIDPTFTGIKLDNCKVDISKSANPFSGELSIQHPLVDSDTKVTYKLESDSLGVYNYFEIIEDNLKIKEGRFINSPTTTISFWEAFKNILQSNNILYLNISATISKADDKETNLGIYKNKVVLVNSKYIDELSTDFWKHGQAGIIDNQGEILPTNWYGKQHPFEFEVIVVDSPDTHKIFDNLQIIGNSAEPESFHYEIIGDSYEFAKDKKNMYIRQEATKELYQNNGSTISYDQEYSKLIAIPRPLENVPNTYEKSTIFPLYYYRRDNVNEINDYYYRQSTDTSRDFSQLAGAEIVKYKTLDEYRIWNHAEAVNIKEKGRMRGNMWYKEDKWYVQINPLIIRQYNESANDWIIKDGKPLIPIELSIIPDDIQNVQLPIDGRRVCKWEGYKESECKLKDKFIKIRVRYSGKNLALIYALKTLYSISYG